MAPIPEHATKDALHDAPERSTLYHDILSFVAAGEGGEKKCFGPAGHRGGGYIEKGFQALQVFASVVSS